MNLRATAKRIQTALCANGRHIAINQKQYYSASQDRMCTIFSVVEKRGKDSAVLCETGSMAEVVKTLAGLLNGVTE